MPATLESLTAKVRELAVEIVPGDPESVITVGYSPLSYSRRQMRLHKAQEAAGDEVAIVYGGFLACVKSWDFRLSEGGDVVPLTDEGLDDVPMEIIGRIVTAIGDDQSPKGATTT